MITYLMFHHPCRITKWNNIILQILEEYHKNLHHIQITTVLISHFLLHQIRTLLLILFRYHVTSSNCFEDSLLSPRLACDNEHFCNDTSN